MPFKLPIILSGITYYSQNYSQIFPGVLPGIVEVT